MSIQIKIGADISGVDKAIKSVSTELNNLKAPVVNAQNQLTSLSGVVRDLPFGFVAIQNNLPLVVDSFGQLTKQAGGVGPALKSIGAALIGPAGLSFAFGAVVAGVTALIQKYGSLGDAFNAILGLAPRVTENQKEYNKAVAEATGNVALEEAKIKILVSTLTNLETPQKQRIAAYNELKKVSPDVVAGIKDENALTAASIDIINKSAEARLASIKLKIQEAGISAVLTKNAEKLATLQQELNIASREYVSNTAALTKAQGQNNTAGLAGVQAQQAAFSAFKSSAAEVSNLQKQISALNTEQESYLKQLQPLVTQTAEINTATKNRTDNLKNQLKNEKELTKELDRQRKEGWQGIIDALKEVDQLAKQTQQSNERVAAVNAKLLQDKAAQNRAAALKKQTEETKKAEQAALDLAIAEGERQFQAPPLFEGFKDLAPRLVQETNAAAGLELFKSSFTSPLEGLFSSFLETGKITFKDFGKIVLQTINQLVAKIVATGIINLLGSILFPGASAAAGVGKGVGGALTSALGSLFGFNFGGGVAAPSFAGVGGGQLGMSGQVNVVLRGQDLVGALNRTNSTINRVG